MDELRIHPPPAIGTEDLERLVGAARAALKYLDDLDRHAPIDSPRLGNEGRIRRQLREAVRLCSYEVRPCAACEVRPCAACDDGTTYAPTRHPMERPRTITCPECSGTGERKVFAYGPPKARRRG